MNTQTNGYFHATFQLSKRIIFEVDYYKLGGNKQPSFSTSACEFNSKKTDYQQCGQAQDDLLRGFGVAMKFYKKWDVLHLKALTQKQYKELLEDLIILKEKYNFIQQEREISFAEVKDISMRPVKKTAILQ